VINETTPQSQRSQAEALPCSREHEPSRSTPEQPRSRARGQLCDLLAIHVNSRERALLPAKIISVLLIGRSLGERPVIVKETVIP